MDDFIRRIEWPPFLFHYIIVFVCAAFITSVSILKFKYLYWYSQPITFQFTIRRWFRGGGGATGHCNTSIMNPLSLGERCNNAIVYPFLHFVRRDLVRVYGGGDDLMSISDAPYERIAEFLSRRDTETPSASDTLYIPSDILELILSQDTFGLSVFIGILMGPRDDTPAIKGDDTPTIKGDDTPAIKGDDTPAIKGDDTPAIKGDDTPAIKGDDTPTIKGVCVLTPRIMLSFGASGSAASSMRPRSVSIYICDHLAWAKYITSERESLALLETTEYIQKSREIAGEQTLYRYHEIPGFVIPFTTVYSYTFAARTAASAAASGVSLGEGMSVIPVSATNFAIFYAFVNERSRDFRCCIIHELTRLQFLVQSGVYRIYMLLLNQVRVMAVYIFAPSWMKAHEGALAAAPGAYTRHKTKPKKTIGNRITSLHNHISQTSTAVVKYLPPVVPPKYDAFGKRVNRVTRGGSGGSGGSGGGSGSGSGGDILRLISSIQQCDSVAFLRGFYSAAAAAAAPRNSAVICIDTFAHNYRIIDSIVAAAHWNLLSREKWYYILYNAIIHQETLCKDILLV
jgi:uncharacterized membrane protein YgcG